MNTNMKQITLKNEYGTEVNYIREDCIEESKPHIVDGLPYVIVRSRDQGVMCGFLKTVAGRFVELLQARQIWKYDSTFVLPDIAEYGPRDESKMMMSVAMSQPACMLEACGILHCTKVAAEKLIGIKAVKK